MPLSWCHACEKYKDANLFRPRYKQCRDCINRKEADRALMRRYGITREEYNAMLAAQDGTCFICKTDSNRNTFHVDHCHATGQVRKILCETCNTRVRIVEFPGKYKRAKKSRFDSAPYIEYVRIHHGPA